MFTENVRSTPSWLQLLSVATVIIALSVATPSIAADSDRRQSSSIHVVDGGRAGIAAGQESLDEYDALETRGERKQSLRMHTSSISGASGTASQGSAAQSTAYDFWFYDADVILFSDDDDDGYFYGIDLLFDADTIYNSAEVYAAVYLSLDGGPWNEYAVTEDFRIYGANSNDEYVLVTELMSGYPTGSYDLLIELFDAFDGSFLVSFGPEDASQLGFLPLEDFNRDAPGVERPVAVSRGGGGATGTALLALMMFALAVRAGRRYPSPRVSQ